MFFQLSSWNGLSIYLRWPFFVYSQNGHSITIILVYVDDQIVTRNNSSYISHLISQLSHVFEMKNLGLLHNFLGIEVNRGATSLFLSQTKYASDLLCRASMLDYKPYSSPCNNKGSSCSTSSPLLPDPSLYWSITGVLQYLTLTRLDITFAVNLASQNMHQPTKANFIALKRILRNLKGTLSFGIFFKRGYLHLTVFSDADWASDSSDRRSTTGFCVFLGPAPISWSAKKQHTIAWSSTEAEFRSLAHTAAELSCCACF